MSIILVVEDDSCLRQEMEDLLKKEGNTVKTASGYQEALQMVLNRELIDLYLVDVMLPDGDGFSLCERIRERNTCPILFLTACSDEESVVKAWNWGPMIMWSSHFGCVSCYLESRQICAAHKCSREDICIVGSCCWTGRKKLFTGREKH